MGVLGCVRLFISEQGVPALRVATVDSRKNIRKSLSHFGKNPVLLYGECYSQDKGDPQ